MRESSIAACTKVSRNRIVYARDGHMVHASHTPYQRTLCQWDYILAEHGGLGGVSARTGELVALRMRNGLIYID